MALVLKRRDSLGFMPNEVMFDYSMHAVTMNMQRSFASWSYKTLNWRWEDCKGGAIFGKPALLDSVATCGGGDNFHSKPTVLLWWGMILPHNADALSNHLMILILAYTIFAIHNKS